MTPTKILLGQILLTFLIVLLTIWSATQWAAHMLGYQMRLGEPWGQLLSIPVYLPWRLFEWWYAYGSYAPMVFLKAGTLAASGGLIGVFAAILGSLWRAREKKNATTFGSSRWATKKQLKRSGFFREKGVVLGAFAGDYLRHDGPEHVMAFAPTRAGKGVGLVVPTLLAWLGSVVVHDLKGENWRLTSGWRSRFSRCLYFNPTDPESACFNPLMEVRKGQNEVRDVQNIADILVDPEGVLDRRNHWEKTSYSLLVGVILHVLYAEKEKTLARVAEILSDPSRPFEATLEKMLHTDHLGQCGEDPGVHPVVAAVARELLNKTENERSGVLSTALSFLTLYRDPVVSKVTARSSFVLRDLVRTGKPVSLYLVVPPGDLSRTRPLIRLILNQIGRRLTEEVDLATKTAAVSPASRGIFGLFKLPGKRKSRCSTTSRLLLMLDEFPALGRLEFFETALAYLAGYGIRAFMISQSLNQIVKAYGENSAILDNCHIRIAFATNDERTAKRVSDSLGSMTERRHQRNYAGHRLAPWLGHVMVSSQETARQLLTPGEIMQLPEGQEIIQISGRKPVLANKIKYFTDRNFIERSLPPCCQNQDDDKEPQNDWKGLEASVSDKLSEEGRENQQESCTGPAGEDDPGNSKGKDDAGDVGFEFPDLCLDRHFPRKSTSNGGQFNLPFSGGTSFVKRSGDKNSGPADKGVRS